MGLGAPGGGAGSQGPWAGLRALGVIGFLSFPFHFPGRPSAPGPGTCALKALIGGAWSPRVLCEELSERIISAVNAVNSITGSTEDL